MAFVFIVAESEADALFYIACAERIKGVPFDLKFYESRRGTGIAQARRMLRYMLADVKNSSGSGNVFWIAAMDNDRSPQQPDGMRPPGKLSGFDEKKSNRYEELRSACASATVSGAIAVPVEMIESWVLQALSKDSQLDLPCFSERACPLAERYYSDNHHCKPPPQLKDLAEEAMQRQGCSDWTEFLIEVAGTLDTEALARHSRSFAFFRDDVARWHLL